MTPADPQPDSPRSDDAPDRPHPGAHPKWVLTTQALDKLLAHFSADREEAGRLYESMRIKLVRFFEWRLCIAAEDLADETLNRVARRIDEGENIFNLSGYFSSVARLIHMESLRERERNTLPLDDLPEMPALQPSQDEQREAGLRCLDHCLEQLPPDNRVLILKYHHKEKHAKIESRKQLAQGLGIPLNALRIRAHRIRLILEQCVRDCLAQAS